jgi:hypothetical protein
VTPVKPSGTVDWPDPFHPHATTLPLLASATVCCKPAAIAVTPVKPSGTVDWPDPLFPQAVIVVEQGFVAAAGGAVVGGAVVAMLMLAEVVGGAVGLGVLLVVLM